MAKYINVKGNPSLVRDMSTGAILNINSSEIHSARKRKHLKEQDKQKQVKLQSDVDGLKQDIGEIKDLLTKILEVRHGNHND